MLFTASTRAPLWNTSKSGTELFMLAKDRDILRYERTIKIFGFLLIYEVGFLTV
jgi:hypothetical protein